MCGQHRGVQCTAVKWGAHNMTLTPQVPENPDKWGAHNMTLIPQVPENLDKKQLLPRQSLLTTANLDSN